MDVRYRFLIPTSPQYIDRVFLYLTQKNHLEGFIFFTLVHISQFLNPGLYGMFLCFFRLAR
jgi:hypothetical protein